MSNLNKIRVVDFTMGRSDSEDVNTDVPFTENFEKTRTIQQANVVLGAYVNRNYKDMQNKADKDEIPTKLSELTNDVGYITTGDIPSKTSDLTNDGEDGVNPFITNQVNDLVNYTNNTDLATLLNGKASNTDLNNVKSAIDYKSTNYMGNVVVESVRSKNMYNINSAYVSGANNQNINNKIILKPNKNYYFKTGKTYTEIKLYDSSNTQTRSLGGGADTTEIGFTTASNEVKGEFIFYSGQNNVDLSTYDFTNIQLEEGTTATSYTPYQNLDGMETYSNGETLIGTFLGKPLYRKVVKYVSTISPGWSGVSFSTLGLSNIEYLRIPSALGKSGNQYEEMVSNQNRIIINIGNSTLSLYLTDGSFSEITFILEYTKTTD